MRNVEGAKAGSNQKKPYRAPVSVTSTQRMRIKYGISEGTIRGFSAEFSYNEMLKRIYLDGTPIMSAEGERLLDVVVEFRDGSRDQEPINGLPSISVEHDVGVEVKIAAPVSRSFDRADTTSYDVRISVPTLYRGDDEGNSEKGLIQFKIDVSTDGGAFEEAGRFEIYEKILNGFAETYNVVVPKGSNHVVRISRLNSEVVSDYSVNRLVVEAITENTDVRLRYTNTAVLYLEYDAEQFSNVPKLEMRVFGKNDILVPANYNGDTHTYVTSGAGTTNGVWDGTWKRAYTDNPVWIALDLMISRRYGLGDKIDLTFINKWELYGLAQYCDEAVADGKGGFEPRFTCNNMYLQKSEDAYRVLKDLAASFRAKVVWDGEFITLQADVPRDPVHTFSNANASDITYSSTQDSAQRNLINVQYYDRDNKFSSDVVMQRSNSNILSRGKVVDGNFTALGCASQGQAQRIASYVMNTELYETELVSFTTGLEGGLVRLNDVIQMADNSVAGQTVGGRIAAVNGRSITLDRKIPDNVQAIATTQLSINRQDVKNEPISIVSISDDRMTAVLASDAPAGTEAGLVWALLTQDLVPQKFVVTDIEFDSTNMTFAVSAIQYNESKYAAIDGSARIVVPPISVTEYKMLKAPIIVIASYLTRIIQDAVVCDIDVSWAQSTNAVQYQLEMQKAGSDWRIVGRFMSLATTLDNMYTGTYTFRVCAYDSLGNASQYTYSDPILVAGKVLPPPALAQYSVVGILFGYQHKWIYPAHTEDSRAVRLRFTTINPVTSPSQDWQYIDVAYPTANFTEQDVSAGLRTWFSAAIVDKYGNVGAYTAWQNVLPSVDATQVLDLLDGQLTAQQLDQDLTNKIAIGAEAAEAAESAQTAANTAKTAAATAQTTASNAQTAANTAKTAATNAMTAASKAQTSANNAAASVNALATEVDADITALSTDLNAKLTTLGNGLTQETTDRQNADTQIVGQLNTYKSSNDAALAAVQQKAESATTASTANAQALTNLTATVNTKNRTYRQTTAPTAGLVLGDLWINTTAGQNNQLRRWNGTAWDDLTDPRTAANATALTNLQTTVTAIDGRTTANANSITQLRTDLTTLSNNVDAKADASAVDALTTRVSTAEGNITSQGTRVTNLENSVNHATTGLSSKASSSALTVVDNKVTAANGRIDTTNSNVTSLTGRVSTVEGAVATKAEASALTALTTRVTNAEGVNTSQGTAITTLQNTVNHATTGLSTKASSAALTTLDNKVTAIDGRVTSNSSSITSLNNSLTTTNTNVTAAQTAATNAMTAAGQKGKVIFGTTAPVAADQLSQNLWIDTTGDANTPKRWNGTAWVVVTDKVATDALAAANAASSLAATKADSSALTALDSKVTTIDGKVTTNASNITTLQGKVTTVENGLATKAEGSALTALTTRVTNAEGVNTSQGSAITTLQNTVNHATTGLSTKASTSALNTLDSKVTGIDGRVTANATSITNLQSGLATANNNIATKADGSALTALTTRVSNAEGGLSSVTSNVTALTASLNAIEIGGTNLMMYSAFETADDVARWAKNNAARMTVSQVVDTTCPSGATNVTKVDFDATTAGGVGFYRGYGSLSANSVGKVFTASVWMKASKDGVKMAIIGEAHTSYATPNVVELTTEWKRYTVTATRNTSAGSLTLYTSSRAASSTVWVSRLQYESGNYPTAWQPCYAETQAQLDANATANTATNTEVSRIDGVVVAQGTSITNLQAGLTTANNNIATKADGSALTSLTTRVSTAEGNITSQSTRITNLENSVNSATNGLATKASSTALSTLDNKVTGIDGRVTANATQLTQLNSSLTTTNNNVTAAQNAADAAASLAGSKGKVLVQTAAPAVADRLVQNLWIDITGNANTPKRWNGSAWVAVTDKVATDAAAAAANALSVAQTKADATALTSLTTKVDTIDGKVTAQATQLSSLSTTVGNHTASITSQQTSIDGLSAKSTIQVAAGNTIGGVSLGNNGGVVDFIVRANTFAIAPPVSANAGNAGKYAFNYRATPVTLPNGTVVPAGIYADNAVIHSIDASKLNVESLSAISANLGTIKVGSANIADLAVTTAKVDDAAITTAKIDNLAVTTAKIGDLQVDTLKIKDNAVTIGVSVNNSKKISIQSSGGKVLVTIGVQARFSNIASPNTFTLKRNGTAIHTWQMYETERATGIDGTNFFGMCGALPPFTDSPPAGTHTYELHTGVWSPNFVYTSMSLMETKK